jgi:hypothetical protein
LSGAKAEIGGYDSRALSSVWISFAFFCSGVSTLFLKKWSTLYKKLCVSMCLPVLFFSYLSFAIQRDNYIKSWEIQSHIIADALKLIANSDLERSSVVIGNVPAYLARNYNNELIFNTYWDFTAALQIFTNRLVKGGPVIDARAGNFHNLRIIDGSLLIDSLNIHDFSHLWFYDFNQSTNKGALEKISNIHVLKRKLTLLGNPIYLGELGHSSAIERGETIDFSKDWINRHHFIKAGFAERESWGVWTSGGEAELILPLPSNGSAGLQLEVRSFILPSHPKQRVEITVNGRKMELITLTKPSENVINIPLTPSDFLGKKLMQINLKLIDAISPKQVGVGLDERALAVGIERAIFY